MMNDFAWTTLHAHRARAHRARARRRGGDDTPAAETSPKTPTAAVTAAVPALTAARRRTASDAPTAAALAWARLASGAGSLAPATPSTTERGRDAA